MTTATSSSSQSGILAAPLDGGRSLVYRLALETDPRAALVRLQGGLDPERTVVGFGEPLVRALGHEVPGLRAFPAIAGAACTVPSTQQALWVMLRGEGPSALFDLSTHLAALVADAFVLDDSVQTFTYAGGRDLTGYLDGTANPSGDDAVGYAIVADGPLAGGSFVAVQRWVHDLARFRSHSRAETDAMVGRYKDSNEEIADAPATAHVKRTAQEEYSPPAFMVRRSMPWAEGGAEGLEFIAYGRSHDAFERQLRRMAGLDDGIVDALFRFSRPVSGGYYFCPPVRDGRIDLACLGL